MNEKRLRELAQDIKTGKQDRYLYVSAKEIQELASALLATNKRVAELEKMNYHLRVKMEKQK